MATKEIYQASDLGLRSAKKPRKQDMKPKTKTLPLLPKKPTGKGRPKRKKKVIHNSPMTTKVSY